MGHEILPYQRINVLYTKNTGQKLKCFFVDKKFFNVLQRYKVNHSRMLKNAQTNPLFMLKMLIFLTEKKAKNISIKIKTYPRQK